ncbi:hypothetical protein [Dechloromonas sp. H13]|uniref:hypothetical protein n=1 Tax=Dechloromonas sp. H13 TaxID=2570193 RepID=UPI001290BC2D|nr:hypothetical protein [Dechloromonas sp. H13]
MKRFKASLFGLSIATLFGCATDMETYARNSEWKLAYEHMEYVWLTGKQNEQERAVALGKAYPKIGEYGFQTFSQESLQSWADRYGEMEWHRRRIKYFCLIEPGALCAQATNNLASVESGVKERDFDPNALLEAEDSRAKSFLTDAQKAALYIFRQELGPNTKASTRTTREDSMILAVNGQILGRLSRNSYIHVALSPGQYFIESQTRTYHQFLLPVSVEAGTQYFVSQEGLAAGGVEDWSQLTLVAADVGRPSVTASKMMELPADLPELTPLKAEPAIATIPLAIGVYYSPGFLGASYNEKRSLGTFGSKTYEIPLGTASQWTFDRALRNTFERVQNLPHWPPAATAEGLDLLLVLHFTNARGATHGDMGPSLSYSAGVFTASGEFITNLSVSGFAFGHVPTNMMALSHYPDFFYFGNSWSSAMGSAAGQLAASIASLPAVAAKGHVVPLRFQSNTMNQGSSGRAEGIAVVPLVAKPKTSTNLAQQISGAMEMQECLQKKLETRHAALRLASATTVRNAAFPWLEAGVTPSSEVLAEILGSPPISEKLKRNDIRFVLLPVIEHINSFGGPFFCGYGIRGAGCLGAAWGDNVTRFTVPVWDVSANAMLSAPITGEVKDFSWAAAYIIPIWHITDTLREACNEISQQVLRALGR